MFSGIGPTEIILVIAVIVLLFGAKKLPDLARGSGRALRIFKSETKGLIDGDDDDDADDEKSSTTPSSKSTDDSTRAIESRDSTESTYDIDEKTGNVVPRDQAK